MAVGQTQDTTPPNLCSSSNHGWTSNVDILHLGLKIHTRRRECCKTGKGLPPPHRWFMQENGHSENKAPQLNPQPKQRP
jgi:hypothetical protein